jgi:phosphate transport system permease protein
VSIAELHQPVALLSPEATARRRNLIRSRAEATLNARLRRAALVPALCTVALLIALTPLIALVAYTTERGIGALSVGFFTHNPVPFGVSGGGIANALVGTGIVLGLALCMALPVGLFVALFLVERRGVLAGVIRFVADVLSGIPSIAIGLFAYALIVVPTHHFSGISASFALAVLMLPIVVRANEEAMRSVERDLWEAGLALGARRSRVVRKIVLRGALGGIVTADLLAMARAVGETAPLLFTAIGSTLFTLSPAGPINLVPLVIYNDGTQPYPSFQQTAWGSAFVLLLFVFIVSLCARGLVGRLTKVAR